MTAIHQNSISNHHSIDDASHQSGNGGDADRGRQAENSGTQEINSSTVNISFHAELRLRAYQEQRKVIMESTSQQPELEKNHLKDKTALPEKQVESISKNDEDSYPFSLGISNMLSEIQKNIVQKSDPGYQYLVNVLNNNKSTVEDPQQLQEIMRKEQFFLSRRKPFMQNSDFQSYSQVLSQFSNIIERQQYAHPSSF
ncbi:MAG: hypothetical protein KZQ83_19420 [gamma proteobacterium symbiont of Taylorina sp.]|nr:hypothetical protein [gamma proteobacterium symbiont of Taylorina sp.]